MCARSSERPPAIASARGYTMVELLAVLVLAGVLAAVGLPKLGGAAAQNGPAWREQVQSALRSAHALAQGHRRLVCVSVASASVTLSIAGGNPASSCGSPLAGPDADSRWAWSSTAPATVATPATFYLQPDGRITSDGAGSTVVSPSITISGESTVNMNGETGHVQ